MQKGFITTHNREIQQNITSTNTQQELNQRLKSFLNYLGKNWDVLLFNVSSLFKITHHSDSCRASRKPMMSCLSAS